MLTEESFAEGFGEGTEDAKEQARYIDGERELMKPLYDFMDLICMHRAWNPEFFATIQKDMPKEYGGMTHEAAFYKWANSFKAKWPSLLTEPESERVKVADVKLRALVAVLEVLMPKLSPDNLAIVVAWVADNMNEMKLLFGSPLYLDYAEIREYVPEAEGAEEGPKKPTQGGLGRKRHTGFARRGRAAAGKTEASDCCQWVTGLRRHGPTWN
jgi:hypothetical protein